MKKRILALALAGTTAFSVFGAAMSANAANWWEDDSTHVVANDDAYYISYNPAGYIRWSTEDVDGTFTQAGTSFYIDKNATYESFTRPDGVSDTYVPAKYTIYTSEPDDFEGNDEIYTVVDLEKMDGYFATLVDFMKEMGYSYGKVDANGQIKVHDGTDGVYTVYSEGTTIDENTQFVITNKTATQGLEPVKHDGWEVFYKVNADGSVEYEAFMPVSNGNILSTSIAGLFEEYGDRHNTPYFIADMVNAGKENASDLKQGTDKWWVISTTDSVNQGVSTQRNYSTLDTHGIDDLDELLNTPVASSGVVYLYDYYYGDDYPSRVSASQFAQDWGKGDLADTLENTIGTDVGYGYIYPETGYGYGSIREGVMDVWEDFLDDLGIADATAEEMTAWAENIYSNYVYTYYDEAVVTDFHYNEATGAWTITIENGKFVDLYNFDELLKDILELAPVRGANNTLNPDVDAAQTSEFVYLMQQYEKYTSEGFVDVNPVDTDDWGDLLVALAQAPTEDEFATANGYKRYTNAVEDLVEEYEDADTSAAVSIAEQNLYKFVTSYNNAYKVSEKADTNVLATAIDNTFFNYNWQRNYSNTVTDVTAPAEVYAGTVEDDGSMTVNMLDSRYGNSWALYPQEDYAGTVSGANPGVDNRITGVTAEYFWFYNVYDLAYNVYQNNEYQSTIELMATTLDEAVAALAPDANSTARASDVLGAEEASDKLADLIETDYVSSMWSNRNKIYNFITERVLNDEIGEVGTNNAEDIADMTAKLMGYQDYQTVVTRSDINSVKTAKTSAETALKDLRDDEDNYNAAQANALEKAIEDCDYIIDIYEGKYATRGTTQTVNGSYNAATGDKDQILKSDITNAVEAVDSAINFANIVMGWTDTEDGWKYGVNDADGPHYLNDGWHQVDGGKTWFYFDENGVAKESTWWQDPATGTWYYFNQNCGAAVGWAKIDGDWYYFKGNNAMKTGWEKVEGSWYYMNSSGKMVTGWCQINGTWYYFSKESNALGQMLANTTTPDGYKVDANGALVE